MVERSGPGSHFALWALHWLHWPDKGCPKRDVPMK
jgi:hypothetical protein